MYKEISVRPLDDHGDDKTETSVIMFVPLVEFLCGTNKVMHMKLLYELGI